MLVRMPLQVSSSGFQSIVHGFDPHGIVINLLAALFSHQPNARPSMTDCLNDPWLRSTP